jgi:tRNA 2-thiouridine synthesizing protein E
MARTSYDLNTVERGFARDADFPHAPLGWSREDANHVAAEEHLQLREEHWELVRALQEFFARHAEENLPINLRELHDALDERFHSQGGIKHLYTLLPGGPIAQGCRLAGLEAPAIATDRSFGSVA